MGKSISTTSNTQTTTLATNQATFAIGDLVLCPSLSDTFFVLTSDPYGKRDDLTLEFEGSYFYYDGNGYFIRASQNETDDFQPSLYHDTPANRQAINTLYTGAPITKSNQVANDLIHAKEAEIQRLSWFDVLFTTIKDDLKNGDAYKAQKLADLGQYLAQDFQHYSEDELASFQEEKGADNE